MKRDFRTQSVLVVLLLMTLAVSPGAGQNGSGIKIQKLHMQLPTDSRQFTETLLPGEIAETAVTHQILAGPQTFSEKAPGDSTDMLLIFIKGTGTLRHQNAAFNIQPESIALPVAPLAVQVVVAAGDTLHYVKIMKQLSPADRVDLAGFEARNQQPIYFKKFDDCRAYTEKIKSPNTVSRTVLPKEYVPRVAMGTVQTKGPDAVGAHAHPMLDQLFLGLAGNDVLVHADELKTSFGAFTLLHIPLGSTHWVTVEAGKQMYYQWMDFFMDKKGQEWLKTHKYVKDKK